MSRTERLIVLAVYIGQVLFVPTAMWALSQPDVRLEMHRWTGPLMLVLAPLSLVAFVCLARDLYKRQLQNKKAWVAAIFLTGGIAMIPYTFIHAFRPRVEDARV